MQALQDQWQKLPPFEEIVEKLDAPMKACVLPTWALTAVCPVPGGAHPSYAHGYYQYQRDNAFCKAGDPILKDFEQFKAWMQKHVLSTADFAEYRQSLADAGEAATA